MTALGEPEEETWLQTTLSPSVLTAGTNVIAVEIHQQSPTSSDISFNLELRGTTPATTPQVTLTSPANQTTVNNSAITFTANATAPAGLASATLLQRATRFITLPCSKPKLISKD